MISKILSNKTLFIPLIFIFLFLFVAIFSYQIMPDDTPMANSIELSIAKKKPGFQAQYLLFKNENNLLERNYIVHFLFGKKKHYDEVIINNYTISGDTVFYSIYNHYTYQIYSELVTNLIISKQVYYPRLQKVDLLVFFQQIHNQN